MTIFVAVCVLYGGVCFNVIEKQLNFRLLHCVVVIFKLNLSKGKFCYILRLKLIYLERRSYYQK